MADSWSLTAIMFTDLVGFTTVSQHDDTHALALLERHRKILRPLFSRYRGREVKTIGDGTLVEFKSALAATNCAARIQSDLRDHNARSGEEWKILVRIGIHLGDVVHRRGDILGDAVNVASRIEPLADPGGICVSSAVFEQVRNKVRFDFEKLERVPLKNVQLPVDVYRLIVAAPKPASPTSAPPRTRIAVLPFVNISPDPNDEYFADGLTEELVTVLAQLPGLSVVARTSTIRYRNSPKSVAQVGTELRVGTVLEGSVRKAGAQIRITAQLVDATTEAHLWAKSFDRNLKDVFAIQSDIARQTAESLRLKLLEGRGLAAPKPPTSSIEAYSLYLKALHAIRRMGAGALADLQEAIGYLEDAIRIDPGFSTAHSQLANVLLALADVSIPMREAGSRARALSIRALQLDLASCDAHTARGNSAMQSDHDWVLAEAEFQRAIELDPSNPSPHFWYGFLLWTLQRFREAEGEYRKALELDPLWDGARYWLSRVYHYAGDYPMALALLREVQGEGAPSPSLHLQYARIYTDAGETEEALRELAYVSPSPESDDDVVRATILAQNGRPEEARQILARWEDSPRLPFRSPCRLATLLSALGEGERALSVLERDARDGDQLFWFYYQRSAFDPIRENPRFIDLLRSENLPLPTSARPGSYTGPDP